MGQPSSLLSRGGEEELEALTTTSHASSSVDNSFFTHASRPRALIVLAVKPVEATCLGQDSVAVARRQRGVDFGDHLIRRQRKVDCLAVQHRGYSLTQENSGRIGNGRTTLVIGSPTFPNESGPPQLLRLAPERNCRSHRPVRVMQKPITEPAAYVLQSENVATAAPQCLHRDSAGDKLKFVVRTSHKYFRPRQANWRPLLYLCP